ncbi:hypothetical protein IPA_02820 [Ignicoccus pacificus DSM 13166]|uniref:Uncharacterized protein n=1 Tax=Ignicoccus pacificus DSM 13166 TaxID=940294 RepID=A0A977PJW4_9CREN|nr:hypothetical protein IPA_02820 [Ignicoccus pacificus DSM 13166]
MDKKMKELLRYAISECLRKSKDFSDETERVACFLACLNEVLEKLGTRLQVTGGFAVELYTGASYRTADIDVKLDNPSVADLLEEALNEIAERGGREWIFQGLLKAIDLLPSEVEECLIIETPCGKLYVERPERLLVRYLAAWKYWNSTEDRDKALMLAYAWSDHLDWEILERLAKKELVEDKLEEVRRWLRRLSR